MAIRLMREKDVPTTTRDLAFRASRLYAILFVLACLGACVAMVAFRWPRPSLAYYISGVIVLLLLLMRRVMTALDRVGPRWKEDHCDDGWTKHYNGLFEG
jgi:hypothetical protein